ncbi:MAG: PIN domain-containing protein [Acidobacteria bacterium]|nr:PIN domain-containing protein [Acidobacteriota bacterium]
MIIADTGALIALFDQSDRHHDAVRRMYEDDPDRWILPWAILPEVDYLVAAHLGPRAQDLWLADLSSGAFAVEWGRQEDVSAADRLCRRYKTLRLGLVDAVVIVVAERLRADAIATLDVKHFGAVSIKGRPRLLPRDL